MTRELLAIYAQLLNKHGVASNKAREFLDQHRTDHEFVELAELSRRLKLALTPSPPPPIPVPVDSPRLDSARIGTEARSAPDRSVPKSRNQRSEATSEGRGT